MARDIVRRTHWLHAWCGVTAGVLIFVVSWTGTFAVFQEALSLWENPRAYEPTERKVDASVRELIEARYGDGIVSHVSVRLPSAVEPGIVVAASASEGRQVTAVVGGEVVETEIAPGPGQVLTRLHTDLLLPSPLGPFLVGFSGVLTLILLVSGVLLHRHIVRDLFVLRLFRSRRLALHDAHTLIGTWALPFHLLLAMSGAVLGFILLAAFLVQQIVYDGDGALMSEDMGDVVVDPSGVRSETANLDGILAAVATLERPFTPDGLEIEHWGDRAARVVVRGEPVDQLVWRRRASFDGATGQLIEPDLDAENSAALAIYATMTPLHYGNFGGLFVQWLYFVLGLVVSVSIGVGLVLWANKYAAQHPIVARLALGVCAGCVAGTAALFPLDLLLRSAPAGRFDDLCTGMFAVWGAVFVVAALVSSWRRTLVWSLWLAAALFAAGAVGSTVASLVPDIGAAQANPAIRTIDASILAIAGVMAWLARLARLDGLEAR